MNAKIKELIEQATEQVSQPEGAYGLISDYVFKFNKEKFAELIIRECADIELYWLSEQDRKAVSDKINEHFGVK